MGVPDSVPILPACLLHAGSCGPINGGDNTDAEIILQP